MANYESVRKIINRGQDFTLAGRRKLREITSEIFTAIDAVETDGAQLDATNVYTAAQAPAVVALTDGATITVDLSAGNVFHVVLDGNRTIDFTNPTAGQHFTMFIQQDDTTGSRTLTWDAVNDWAGGTAPTLTTTTDAVDVLSFVVDHDGNIHGLLGIADSK